MFPTDMQRGVTLYLAFMTMTVLLSISLGLSILVFGQLRLLRGIGDSVVGLYASDAGIDFALYQDRKECLSAADPYTCVNETALPPGVRNQTLSNGSTFELRVDNSGEFGCPGLYCVKSTGTFNESRRSIRIAR